MEIDAAHGAFARKMWNSKPYMVRQRLKLYVRMVDYVFVYDVLT